jgi:hypothetical protein
MFGMKKSTKPPPEECETNKKKRKISVKLNKFSKKFTNKKLTNDYKPNPVQRPLPAALITPSLAAKPNSGSNQEIGIFPPKHESTALANQTAAIENNYQLNSALELSRIVENRIKSKTNKRNERRNKKRLLDSAKHVINEHNKSQFADASWDELRSEKTNFRLKNNRESHVRRDHF